MKKFIVTLLVVIALIVTGCTVDAPYEEDSYFYGTVYVWNGTAYQAVNFNLGTGESGNETGENCCSELTTHIAETSTHGATASVDLADELFVTTRIGWHSNADTEIHGIAFGDTVAGISNITNHASLTNTHGVAEIAGIADIITEHHNLNGLSDDDHSQYALDTDLANYATTTDLTNHSNTTNTHGVTEIAGIADVSSAITTHETTYHSGSFLTYPTSDHEYDGIIITGIAEIAISFGEVISFDSVSNKWELADYDTLSTITGTIGIAVESVSADESLDILIWGLIKDSTFPSMSADETMFISDTAGNIVNTASSGAGYFKSIGSALESDVLFLNPDNIYYVMNASNQITDIYGYDIK